MTFLSCRNESQKTRYRRIFRYPDISAPKLFEKTGLEKTIPGNIEMAKPYKIIGSEIKKPQVGVVFCHFTPGMSKKCYNF